MRVGIRNLQGPRVQEKKVFFKLRLRTLWIVLLVLSSLWVADVFGPLIYSVLSPKADFQDIVHVLEGHGTPPPQVTAPVQETIASAGTLQRAIQVGYYSGVTATFQLNASHATRKTQVSYLAWFQKLPKPTILVINRYQTDGGSQNYEIGEGDIGSFARVLGLPLLALVFSIFAVRKRDSPLLNDLHPEAHSSRTDQETDSSKS
jgi:hypothetical protein